MSRSLKLHGAVIFTILSIFTMLLHKLTLENEMYTRTRCMNNLFNYSSLTDFLVFVRVPNIMEMDFTSIRIT